MVTDSPSPLHSANAQMNERVVVHHGDSRDVLKTLADSSIDSCVCDPPYALVSIVKRFGKDGAAPAKGDVYARAAAGFMGKQWDTGETAFDPDFWREVLRVLKPGAHVVAFSGTRTYHRLACAIEDAGFEIRDQIAWLYGSGFPKSHDVAKGIDKAAGAEREVVGVHRRHGGGSATSGSMSGPLGTASELPLTAPATPDAERWEGWGTALKPALEPIVLARKPINGTVAANVLEHGTGALNIDASRVGWDGSPPEIGTPGWGGPSKKLTAVPGQHAGTVERTPPSPHGRWPANVIHDGSDEVVKAFPAEAGAFAPVRGSESSLAAKGDAVYSARNRVGHLHHGDSGSAARFFYSAKADSEDRLGSKHPTVKPVDLMAYLCRLVTPPGGVVLDPFAGTGTTGLGAMRGGFRAILIEREAEYVADINRRLAWARGEGRLTALETARVDPAKAVGADLPLFSGDAA